MQTTALDFRHEALFYAGQDEFLAGTTSFIRDGLEGDAATLVVVSARKIDSLRSALGSEAERVSFADMAEVGANPARIIPAWREFVDQHGGTSRPMRGIGEPIWAGRSPAELLECQRHESLLNLAFADMPDFHLLCPYDTDALSTAVIEEARRSHQHLCDGGEHAISDAYRGLEEVAAPFSAPLPEPVGVPHSKVFQANTLGALRHFVAGHASEIGFDGAGSEELVLAVNEVATNSVLHAGGGGILRIWPEDGALVCEVNDIGHIHDPLAGRERPEPDREGGHGLWMANQLCDLVQIRSFKGGSAVRLHKRLG